MPDPRFFSAAGPFTLEKLAKISGAEIGAGADPGRIFADVASLDAAGREQVSFLDNKKYVERFKTSDAGACLLHPDFAEMAPPGMALLLTPEPYRAYGDVAEAFYPLPSPVSAIAPTAVVHGTARLGEGCSVGPGAVIGKEAELGRRCVVGPNTVIGSGVVLGDDCSIGPGATLVCCILGAKVIVHCGVRIGQDGFGFALGPQGHRKVPQLGRGVIGNDVEIGANTTIDRGAVPDTVIGDGTKIDNLVQIGHNVRLGRGCIVVSQVGISGSTTIGDFVMIGGQAGLTGHLSIGDGAQIAAQSGVMRDISPGIKVGGAPALPVRDWLRGVAALERMGKKK